MKDKVGRPKDFSDAEAEAYTRYLTRTERKKTIFELASEILQKRVASIEEVIKEKWRREWWKK